MKNNTIMCIARASNSKRDCEHDYLLLLAATVRSFAHMPLGISDRNKINLSGNARLRVLLGQQVELVT